MKENLEKTPAKMTEKYCKRIEKQWPKAPLLYNVHIRPIWVVVCFEQKSRCTTAHQPIEIELYPLLVNS